MKKFILLFSLFLSAAALTHAAVGDPSGFFWSGTLDGNRNHLNDGVFEFKETDKPGLYVLDADDYNVVADSENPDYVYNGVKEQGVFNIDNTGDLRDVFFIQIRGAYVGLTASIASVTEITDVNDKGETYVARRDTVFNTIQKDVFYHPEKDTTPKANIKYATEQNLKCERIFLYFPSYYKDNKIDPILYFTDDDQAAAWAKIEPYAVTDVPEAELSDYLIVINDNFSNEYRFRKTAYTDVYELVGQFNITDQFKISKWIDDGNGGANAQVAWREMNLGRDVKGAKGRNETVDRKFKNNAIRDIVVGSPFALVSGNDPMWINDGEDSNDNPETVTFKKAIFVYHPVFPSLYLTNDPTYEWIEGQLSDAHLCADEIQDSWGNTHGLANSFKTTKFPQVYEYTGLITFTNPGVEKADKSGWQTWPSRLQIKIGEQSDPDHVILGYTNANYNPTDGKDKIGLNEPFSMHTFNQDFDNSNYYGNDVHTELPFTFHRAFLYYNGYGDENPVLYLVGDPNFEARPLDVLYEGFPVNLFMRGDEFTDGAGNKNTAPARHRYQFYTTDQPNVYELNHANDKKNTNLMQTQEGNTTGTYEFRNTFRVGGKELTEPWRVELGDVVNPTTQIELSTAESGAKPYALSNNSGNSANFTQVTPAIGENDPSFIVYRTVLNYDGGAMPILTIYGYQNTEEVNTDGIVFGRSHYALKVWKDGEYSTASWDNSGGLTDCIDKNLADRAAEKTEQFMQDYIYLVTDNSDEAQPMIVFYGPMNYLDETEEEYIKPERANANVYVIDFTEGYPGGDGVPAGIPVTVPAETDNGDVSIPLHLASGVRFAVYNYNYVPQSATDALNMRKYLKYGHAFRLNEGLRPLRGMITNEEETVPLEEDETQTVTQFKWSENVGGVKWDESGVYSATNQGKEFWNNGSESIETSLANQKIGDNRILSEYNFYLRRIILEVVNDGKDQTEQLYIRFEGRYDLEGKMEANRVYYYNAPNSDDNGVVEEANIVVGTNYVGRDRAFNRYYANTDRNLLGGISDEELNALTTRGIYPNLTDGYRATTTYTVKCPLNDTEFATAFTGNRDYQFEIPMTAAAVTVTTDERVTLDTSIDSNNPKYGTATPYLSVEGEFNETRYFDPAMTTAPTAYEVSTVYAFGNAKIAEPAYVGTGTFDNSDNFAPNPGLTAVAKERGVNAYDGWYNSTLTIVPNTQKALDGKDLPVTRYTITQQDSELKNVVFAESYENLEGEKGTGWSDTDWSQEGVLHDKENKDTRTELDNVWITYQDANKNVLTQKLVDPDKESVTIQYDLTQYYTFVYPQDGYYTEDQIKAANLLGVTENGTSNDVKYTLRTKTATATATATFNIKDEKIGTTGIDSVGYEDVAVGVENGAIVISGSDAEAAVYTTSGQAIYVGTERRIEVSSGVYIVKVAGQVSKVAVI